MTFVSKQVLGTQFDASTYSIYVAEYKRLKSCRQKVVRDNKHSWIIELGYGDAVFENF